jgi:hypothetical protein
MNKAATIQKHVYLPSRLAQVGEKKAKKFGYSLTKYMEYLLMKDVEEEIEEIEILDEKTSKEVGKAMEDVKRGKRGKLLETEEDIENYFS